MGIQSAITTVFQRFRAANGVQITFKGAAYQATTRAISGSEAAEYLPDGGQNVAQTDMRVFAFSPQIFTAETPDEEDVINYGGVDYTITKANLTNLGSTLICYSYRAPKVAISSQDAAQRAAWPSS